MKSILTLILLLISTTVLSQEFITEEEFDVAITGTSAFGDNESIVVIEVWAEFNKDNAFHDWKNLKGLKYHRLDLANAPGIKKKYRIRMVPTILVFVDGSKELEYKAGLDLVCPVTLEELNNDIEELKQSTQF
mgnify:FL=1|tara:strand:- start:3235 stop:3633 length:399 start_codon:yes stop_codon:yes gene_type:complete